MPTQWMIDCETIDLGSRAGVWELSIVNINDRKARKTWYTDPGEIAGLVDAERCTASTSTIDWSLKVHGPASKFHHWHTSYSANGRASSELGVTSIADIHASFVQNTTPEDIYWCKGSDFDFPILANMFQCAGKQTPWHYRRKGCLRSFAIEAEVTEDTTLQDTIKMIMARNRNLHSSLDDCFNQIDQLQAYRPNLFTE